MPIIFWHPVRTSLRTLSGLHHDSRADLQHYAPASAPSPRCCTPYGSLLWGRLGMVPPLPLNSVTAAFRAVYLSPVGASALGWLGSESHLMRDELWFALQRKSLQVLALRVTARSHLRDESQSLKALVRWRRYTNGTIIAGIWCLCKALTPEKKNGLRA